MPSGYCPRMDPLLTELERVAAETKFSGVVRVDRSDEPTLEVPFGMQNRATEIPNTTPTRFAMASGSKVFTALAVVSLVEDGTLTMDTTARSQLGSDLPLIADEVTVEQLLAHRSGIGDYLEEDSEWAVTDYVMGPVHEYVSTEAFLKVLDGFPMVFTPGERFKYCNGGYVVLALIAERASGIPFHQLVRDRVTEPAGMTETGFLRSDELPGNAALGYFDADGPRTNIFHLPVLGNGDGGAYSTTADMYRFWTSLFEGKIVPTARVEEMVRPRSHDPGEKRRYGLGFWLDEVTDTVVLEGFDAGASFWSVHDPGGAFTCTVMSNTSPGAWPIAGILNAALPSWTGATAEI